MFRPCIDIHCGKVKQIVGGTLLDSGAVENFVSEKPSSYYAGIYKENNLIGGHVIMLGKGNEEAAEEALKAFPFGLQIGGGITVQNCTEYIKMGASHVIVTSALFTNGAIDYGKCEEFVEALGGPHCLVIDLSCRRKGDKWFVATDRWQTITETEVNPESLRKLSEYCSEFLVHAADVEGLQRGVDRELLDMLAEHCPIPCTYAGGARGIDDLHASIDVTIGSALDIFGGKTAALLCLVSRNNEHPTRDHSVRYFFHVLKAIGKSIVCDSFDLDGRVEFWGESAQEFMKNILEEERATTIAGLIKAVAEAKDKIEVFPPRILFKKSEKGQSDSLISDVLFLSSKGKFRFSFTTFHSGSKITHIKIE